MKLFDLFPPQLELGGARTDGTAHVTGLHSGNLGDAIYSLPTAFALGVSHFILNVCADPTFGNRVMTTDSACKLAPLLLGQGTIERVSVIQSNVPWEFAQPAAVGADYVLDAFRCNWTDNRLHLIHRHALPFGVKVGGEQAWMTSEGLRDGDLPTGVAPSYLVVALTERYRRIGDDWYGAFLRDLPPEHVVFVGVESDLRHKPYVPGAHLRMRDFSHLARVLKGSAAMVGNPSFPYALAEALKVPRYVELPDGINVAPLDGSGLAMHLYDIDWLRERLFASLGLRPPDFARVRASLASAEARAAELDRTIASLQGELRESQHKLACLQAGRALPVAHAANALQPPIELKPELKRLTRHVMHASPLGAKIYRRLARNRLACALWRWFDDGPTSGPPRAGQ